MSVNKRGVDKSTVNSLERLSMGKLLFKNQITTPLSVDLGPDKITIKVLGDQLQKHGRILSSIGFTNVFF